MIRSSMMPSSTIAIPAARPLPKLLPWENPVDDVEAERARADQCRRRRPSTAPGRCPGSRRAAGRWRDIGSWTFQSSCRRVEPDAVAASMTVAGTVRIPTSTSRITGGDGVDDRGDDRREAARAEQGEGRDQVDEGRHRLGRVEDRPKDRPEAIVARRLDPDGDPDDERQQRRRRGRWPASPSQCSHRPSSTIRPRQTAAMRAGRRPETVQAISDDDRDHQPPRRRRSGRPPSG